MAASTETLEAQLAATMIAIAYIGKKAGVDTKDLKAFAAKSLQNHPEPRRTTVLQTLEGLVDAYEAVA